jgi:hypothetical protein
MRRFVFVLVGAALGIGVVSVPAAPSASTATLCVGKKPGCYPTIQTAVDAARDGDTIIISPGTYAGGVTISKSLNLVGSGVQATTISGGGPVVTIGDPSGQGTPVVTVSRVTITGGLNDAQPRPDDPQGGGVSVLAAATVTISDSDITGNRVTPQSSGFVLGGGIDNNGTLTLTNTRVTENVIGSTPASPSPAFHARGGGINNHPGATLTLRHSAVTGNRVAVTVANPQLGVAGGISDDGGVLVIEDSAISNNSVAMAANFAGELDSFTGGIEVTKQASATISRTTISGNSVEGTNAGGDVMTGAGGISTDPDVTFVLQDSAVDRNSVTLDASTDGTGGTAFAGGLELEGNAQVSRCQFIGNDVNASAASGAIVAIAGGVETRFVVPTTLSDNIIAGNTVEANITDGFAAAAGGGIFNAGLLTLRRAAVINNNVTVTSPAGLAEGGGIWNGPLPVPDPPDVALTVIDSAIVGNRLQASQGITPLGGGLFTGDGFSLTPFPVTLTRTVIAGNQPDQCFNC